MARLSYADPAIVKEVAPNLVDRVIAERGDVLHLYAMLMNSPVFADGWLTLLTAIRHKGHLSGTLRELMILRVAHLNHAPYEAEQHGPVALREGLSEEQVRAAGGPADAACFDDQQRAALAYCDAMTLSVHVPAEVFDAARYFFDPRELTELTVTIAAYNMVSRVLEALAINSGDDKGNWK